MQRPSNLLRIAALTAFGLGVGLAASGCTQAEANLSQAAPAELEADGLPAGPYRDRDPALAKQLADGGALILDVRSPGEFAQGHVDGAVNISHTQVRAQIAKIEQMQGGDHHKPIVLYCRSGQRASLAKRELEAAGFDRVTNLGSIDAWRG
jgi:phage shock protein E